LPLWILHDEVVNAAIEGLASEKKTSARCKSTKNAKTCSKFPPPPNKNFLGAWGLKQGDQTSFHKIAQNITQHFLSKLMHNFNHAKQHPNNAELLVEFSTNRQKLCNSHPMVENRVIGPIWSPLA
jgi:hypothetical protein